jgi:hypothetical protein
MTDIEVAGNYEGIGGKFKFRGSFPIIMESCQYLMDRIKLDKTMYYISVHGSTDGKVEMSRHEINFQK